MNRVKVYGFRRSEQKGGGYPKFGLPHRELRETQSHVPQMKAQPRPYLTPKGRTGSILCLRVIVGKVGVEQCSSEKKLEPKMPIFETWTPSKQALGLILRGWETLSSILLLRAYEPYTLSSL